MATLTASKLQPTSPGEEELRLLTESSIDYDVREIAFIDIDLETSKHNQARFLALHEDVVINYAAAMEQGDVFPPIIVTGKPGKYIVLDGNHRVAAAGLVGYMSTTAFIARNITKAQSDLLIFEANARHGLPTSIEERVAQGVYLVNLGNQPKVVAKALAVPERKLYTAIGDERTKSRLTKLGIDPAKIPAGQLHRIGAVTLNTVLQPVAEMVVKSRLDTAETNELITAINAETSGESAQLRVVESYRERYKSRAKTTVGGKLSVPKDVTRVKIATRMVRHINPSALSTALANGSPELAKEIRRDVFESISQLVSVSEAIKNA